MEVRVAKELIQACPALNKKPFSLNKEDRLRWETYTELDLAAFTKQELQTLQKAVSAYEHIRGTKTLIRDISNWVFACGDRRSAAKTAARSCKQACALLINYIGMSPRKHVYARISNGNEGVTVPYFVQSIEYHPSYTSHGDRIPERVEIDAAYYEFGIVRKTTWTLYASDCLGKTPHAILGAQNLSLENTLLRSDYEEFADKYAAIYDKIGEQYLAVGRADNESVNCDDDDDYRRKYAFRLDANGEPARVVIDIFREKEGREGRDEHVDTWFWRSEVRKNKTGDLYLPDDDELEEDETTIKTKQQTEIPIHPYVVAFDLKRHRRLRIHVGNLTKYKYDKTIRKRLVLPAHHGFLIDTLLVEKESKFRDIIQGKSGGTVIVCQGKPGTGKTLTAEVYAEYLERPLYSVQCSQLGTDPDHLEELLLRVLARGRRWGAVMLLDEADVYVHERGNNLEQNAIVGVFLRVLEYQTGVLFFTTNRGDLVDDAILSRCTARIPYEVPSTEDQLKIWRVLADANGISLSDKTIQAIVQTHPRLSGRDIKNLLKLAAMVAHSRDSKIDVELVSEVKQFKPTSEEM